MNDAESLIPNVTDEDIEWAGTFLGLDRVDEPRREFLKCRSTLDLSACPGSGKTTLIVAKLAILARKWSHRTKGICVLSHTNVAREQIEHRLGRTVVGQRLLTYPHYIDTIHGFVNRFFALPWLHSNRYPVNVIDDGIALRHRWFNLQNKTRHILTKCHHDQEILRVTDGNFSLSDIRWANGTLRRSTSIYQELVTSCKESIMKGFHCYDEMFVWADALLEAHSKVPMWLAHRFPLILLDEMQDTSETQATFLNRVFPRASDKIIVQRVGDSNQTIFDYAPDAKLIKPDTFPDARRCIGLANSYRFGKEIAAFASPFAVDPVGTDGLTGIGPKGADTPLQRGGHAVFVFSGNSTNDVLDVYGRHVLSVLGAELAGKGLVTAVGHTHRDDPQVSAGHNHYPKSVCHYWNGYSVEIARKDANPSKLAQYVRAAQALTADGNVLSPGVEKIASGILRLARSIGDIGGLERKVRTHHVIIGKLENAPDMLSTYRDVVRLLLAERATLSENSWSAVSERMAMVAAALCDGNTDMNKEARSFLDWPQENAPPQLLAASMTGTSTPNVYRVEAYNGSIDIRLSSIHSVKGQTHLATLLLSTYWHDHSGLKMMPWLTGKRTNGNGAGNRDIQRLLHTYVAMTRPSHLICVAVPRFALGKNDTAEIAALRHRGWRVAEITEEGVRWHECKS